jgi:hypothetical protein
MEISPLVVTMRARHVFPAGNVSTVGLERRVRQPDCVVSTLASATSFSSICMEDLL